jgi:NTE family protein
MIGALCASGVPPWFMVAHSAGETFEGVVDADGRPAAEADRSAGAVYKLERAVPPIGPGSWSLAMRSMLRPHRHTPAAVVAGWLPRGVISTRPLEDIVRRVVPTGWSSHPNLWIVACDYATGRRVPFGRKGAPEADLAEAVAASCAIPGFYHPLTIGRSRYVDGGLYSNSNLDLLRDEKLDLVICLNPTSTLYPMRAWNPAERIAALARRDSGRRLGSEARKLRAAGTQVVLIQPTRKDLEVMGPNLMSRRRRHDVIRTSIETVGEQLRDPEVADLLSKLPPGDPERVSRPPGPPSTWQLLSEAS